jgi:arabinose-5-phosphate isomerase
LSIRFSTNFKYHCNIGLGDALAVALLEARGFTADDFARSHPAGALGKRLLHVKHLMHTGMSYQKYF